MLTALLLSLALYQTYAPPRPTMDPLDAQGEMRVQRVGKQLRCAVCQGVSIADSPASMARAQLDKVRELIIEGRTDDEIYDFFVERYGEWALMKPKKSGVTLGLWIFPVFVFCVGLLVIWRRAKKPQGHALHAETNASKSDDYLAKVRADMES